MAKPARNAKRLVRSYEDLKQKGLKARRPHDRDALLNTSFFLDEQYVEWSDAAASIQPIPITKGDDGSEEPRPVVNKIMHFVMQEHSFALQNEPVPTVLPAGSDYGQMSDALVCDAYLRFLLEPTVTNFDQELSDAVQWALIANEAYLKWFFNAKTKRPDMAFVPSTDLVVDPYPKDFYKARWAIHTQTLDPEQVYDTYGVDPSALKLAKGDKTQSALLRDIGQAPILQGVEVNELWYLPDRRYPKGLYSVWSGNELLPVSEEQINGDEEPGPIPYPYKNGKEAPALPFTIVGAIPLPKTYHCASPVKYLRGPQMELNKFHAQRINVREAFSNPKWYVPPGLELEADPDNSPNQILRGTSGDPAAAIQIIQPTVFPENNDGQWIVEEMQHVIGIHETSQGQVPGRVEAAKAIETLQEADKSRLAQLLRSIRISFARGGYQMLQLAKQYVNEEEFVQAYGMDGVPEVRHFKGDMVSPGQRITVSLDTGLSRTRAGRYDQLVRLWELQIITDPEEFARLLDIPTSSVLSTAQFDTKKARNENYTLADGKAVEPNSWDNHPVHLQEHNNWRKTPDYLTASEEVKARFEHHCQRHEELWEGEIEKQVKRQAIAAAAAQPPGPAAPGPGGPPAPNAGPTAPGGPPQ